MQRIFIESDCFALDREQETGGHGAILDLCTKSERARMDKGLAEIFFPPGFIFINCANYVLAQ